ncbi:uncharacterized protein LOC143103068 [Alosa pseudoharengus]|uniref:uncharacterized protein LOC143103068 n=1 Tax=Alosa pseudoharengus TaxID=34774 RepID=UPI003F8A37DC
MNHDYSPTLQKKRREYSGIKKQLKAKQIKFQSPYPAMLKVFVQEDTLVFHSAWEAAEGLKHLGITAELSEEERLEKDLHRLGWTASGMKNPRAQVNRKMFRVMEGFLGGLENGLDGHTFSHHDYKEVPNPRCSLCITLIKMKFSITLVLLSVLFSEVAALTCYQCHPDTLQNCTNATETCSTGSCASITLNTYIGGIKYKELNYKNCLRADQCISGSVNFGDTKLTISTECCKRDRCNSQNTPELNTNTTPNGKKCLTAVGEVSCVGNEDRCVIATFMVGGMTPSKKGCASSSMCAVDMLVQLGLFAAVPTCYEGTNSEGVNNEGVNSEGVMNVTTVSRMSFLFLLGSLVSVLLFH